MTFARNFLKSFAWLAILSSGLIVASPGHAAAWAEVGDAQLRSDVALLANAGLLENLTMQWPLPWRGVADALSDDVALMRKPRFIQEAARRVRSRALRETDTSFHSMHIDATVDGTNTPALIRGYDAQGIGKEQAQVVVDFNRDTGTTVHLAVGAINDARRATGYNAQRDGGRLQVMGDGSYIAQRLGGAMVYAGLVDHWWGPGWISALSVSNNARPIPQIGIASSAPQAFKTPLLSWIGPWRAEFFVGVFDGNDRIAHNTLYNALRVTFAPVKGLEIGFTRTQMLCGSGHSCNPLKSYFSLRNDAGQINNNNDQANIDLRYTNAIAGHPFEIYTQAMNEDTNPFVHGFTSHLVGASVWVPVAANTARITAEYTSSIATEDIFSFGKVGYGISYNNSSYKDGMRYRGRTLGFSLDSDSRLLTLQAALTDAKDRSYTLSLHRAHVSSTPTGAANILTPSPVAINYAEARVVVPTSFAQFSLSGRIQDDQPRPSHGFGGAIEAAITFHIR